MENPTLTSVLKICEPSCSTSNLSKELKEAITIVEKSEEIRFMENGKVQKYEIVIYWDNNDKIFVAEVPELVGCAAHGKTQIEAVKNVGDAIELWLETAREFGDEIPEPRPHRLAA